MGSDRAEALALHPTVKPVRMVADAILDASDRGAVVVDAFLGSGTTLIAAEQTGRRCFGLELEPKYIDITIERFRQLTGVDAVHAGSGATFTAIKERRRKMESTDD